MLEYSPKGTVPILVIPSGDVIDESRDVMNWALSQHDPVQWRTDNKNELIEENDSVFKQHLDQYKYADRYPDHPTEYYRDQCEIFLQRLESSLINQTFLMGDQITDVDISIFPFIRQFAFVDKVWFDQSTYPQLQKWLNYFLESDLFLKTMIKYPPWKPEDSVTLFP
jgi:glutathione S-transferase